MFAGIRRLAGLASGWPASLWRMFGGTRRRRAAVVAAVAVVGLAAFGMAARTAPADRIVVAELQAYADLAATDLLAATATLPADMQTTLTGDEDGAQHGWVAKTSRTGRCWGFPLSVDRRWVTSGSADWVRVGEVARAEPSLCDPSAAAP